MSLPSRTLLAAALLLGASLLGSSREASACGGLFCSSANPVNQAAERIVFAKNEDDTVTAVIEILYEGPSESFAWVLPVPSEEVTVGVSSRQALDALQQASNPQYALQTSFEEGCVQGGPRGLAGNAASGDSTSAPASPSGPGSVTVIASGNVGPYDYVQIAVDPEDEDPAQAAIDWLEENGYDVGALGPDLLRPYLAQDMDLLAFRLTKGNQTGSIRPVMLTYSGKRPLIPIQPTAVAANDDMGILVWVLGNGRAVPTNYLALELNDARIDWFNPNPTYNDVVSRAADEAGGQGFVTEQSGAAGTFSESLFPSWKAQQFEQLRSAQFESLEEFLMMAQSVAASHVSPSFTGFGGPLGDGAFSAQNQYDGFLDLLGDPEVVPLREGATAAQLNACVSCYFQVDVAVRNDAYPSTPFDPETDPLLDMDVKRFLDAMEALVIAPLRDTRALFEEHSHVTRLYTTMSADEMTVDPEFDLNPALEDVSNVKTAERIFECNGTDWTIRLPSGIRVTGSGSTWPVEPDETKMPFNARVMQLSTSGEGDVVLDNTDLVVSRLIDLGATDMLPGEPPDPASAGKDDDGSGKAKSDGGCAVTPTRAGLHPAAWALFVASLWCLRRRRATR